MNINIAKTGVFFLLMGFLTLGIFSCRKKGNTIVQITVVDTAGSVINGAMVRLYPTPTLSPQPGTVIYDDTMYTGVDGVATYDYTDNFNLGQAGFVVFDIEVRVGDSLFGQGIIKVEEEKTSKQKVIAQ